MRATPVVFALLLGICRPAPPAKISIDASPSAMSLLAGKWAGDYSSAATGRSGSIVFILNADEQSARGDVIMYSTIVNVPADPSTIASARGSHAADVLKINFVRAAGNQISGQLDPYRDPNTGAMISTTFTGRIFGDTIEGTFESLSSDSNTPQRGRWRVKRV